MNSSIYFDHASTSGFKPEQITQEIGIYLKDIHASPGRGGYSLETKALALIEDVREQLASLLDTSRSDQVNFTYNATQAINLVLKGLLKTGDHVIISSFEHNAVYRPLHRLSMENGVAFDIWKSDAEGVFDLEKLESLIKPETKLIVLNHASNVLGVISPVEAVGKIAARRKIRFLVDVSQTAGFLPTKFASFADYIAGTGHKSLMGPPGVGFLFVKDSETLTTLYEGGSGKNSHSGYHPETTPEKFEAGTINYLGIAGLKGSLSYLKAHGIEKIRTETMHYTEEAIRQLKDIPGLIFYGPTSVQNKVPLIAFNIEGLLAAETGYLLNEKGICVRSGLQCAPLAHDTMGTLPHGVVRLSFNHKNTHMELLRLIEALHEIEYQSRNQGCINV